YFGRTLNTIIDVRSLLIVTWSAKCAAAHQNRSDFFATTSSLPPASWRSPAAGTTPQPKPGLKLVGEIPLPGPANRFDYQSVDPATGRIYMNHMNAGRTIVFDANNAKLIADI